MPNGVTLCLDGLGRTGTARVEVMITVHRVAARSRGWIIRPAQLHYSELDEALCATLAF